MSRRDELIARMEDCLAGRVSFVNLGPHEPYTPDVVAAMDAQEAVKLAAAISAYTVIEETCPHGFHSVASCFNCEIGIRGSR